MTSPGHPHHARFHASRFERRGEPLAPPSVYRRRLARHAAFTGYVIGVSLLIGVLGYHLLAHYGWVDSIYSASMILGGMGPVGPELTQTAPKLFASAYALYSGIVLIASVGILLSPALHRIMHRFHIEEEGGDS
jgi:hypothetical protein